MDKICVDDFQLSEQHIQLLLAELKEEKVSTKEQLKRYLQNYEYVNDPTRQFHLLLSPTKKKKNFALPYDEE